MTTSPVKISKAHKLEFQYRGTLLFGSVNLPLVGVRIQPMTHVVTERYGPVPHVYTPSLVCKKGSASCRLGESGGWEGARHSSGASVVAAAIPNYNHYFMCLA